MGKWGHAWLSGNHVARQQSGAARAWSGLLVESLLLQLLQPQVHAGRLSSMLPADASACKPLWLASRNGLHSEPLQADSALRKIRPSHRSYLLHM